jgi:site-specific DNA recombinase
MRAVIYARVSTGRQVRNEISLPDQLERLRKFCDERELHIVHEFIEPGLSAGTDKRPIFNEMMEYVKTEGAEIDFVLAYSLDRLFRNQDDSIIYGAELEPFGVQIQYVSEQFDNTPMGKLSRFMSATVATTKIHNDAAHTARGLRRNAELGFFNGSKMPFGYKVEATDLPARSGTKKLMVLCEEEAEIVRRIYDLYEFGINGTQLGFKRIAEYLNERNCTRRGTPWDNSFVHRIISDEVYTGKYMYGARSRYSYRGKYANTGDPVEMRVPVIIPEERFKRLTVKRRERAPYMRPARHTTPASLLAGLLKCGYCGSAMTVTTGKSGRYSYLKCSRRNKMSVSACASPSIPRAALEREVMDIVCREILTPERFKAIVEDCKRNIEIIQRDEISELNDLNTSKRQTERQLKRLCDAIEIGDLRSKSYVSKRVKTLEQELEAIESRISDIKIRVALPNDVLPEEKVPEFVAKLRAILLDTTDQAAAGFLRLLVSEIRVFAEDATISGSLLGAVQAGVDVSRAPSKSETVPSFMVGWRARRDSNSRPPGS